MIRIAVVSVLLASTGMGIWLYSGAHNGDPIAAGGMSANQFSQESPLLLPGVLAEVYKAFRQTEETAIYDHLAKVATGKALEELYLERVGAMASGGLKPDQEIHEISLLSMSARPEGGTVKIDARWRVLGVVGHDEHMHMRGNAYSAELVMSPDAGLWKLSGFTLTDVDRTDAGTLQRNSDALFVVEETDS